MQHPNLITFAAILTSFALSISASTDDPHSMDYMNQSTWHDLFLEQHSCPRRKLYCSGGNGNARPHATSLEINIQAAQRATAWKHSQDQSLYKAVQPHLDPEASCWVNARSFSPPSFFNALCRYWYTIQVIINCYSRELLG